MSYFIRQSTVDDAPKIYELVLSLADFEHLLHEVKLSEETLRGWLAAGEIGCLLAFDGEVAVGFALYYYTYSTFRGQKGLFLEDLFVKVEYRKQGIGRAFFAALARLAVAQNCFRIDWLVLSWNRQGIDFYNTLGGRAVDDWILYRLNGAPLSALSSSSQTE